MAPPRYSVDTWTHQQAFGLTFQSLAKMSCNTKFRGNRIAAQSNR
jgi:hypothetical protein